jgi:hypothetical protein
MVMACMKPWIRQQELAILSALPEVLDKGGKKLLRRLGCQNAGKGGLEGSWQGDWSVMQVTKPSTIHSSTDHMPVPFNS